VLNVNLIPRSLHEDDVSAFGIAVYSALCCFADERGICEPTYEQIAKTAKLSKTTTKRILQELMSRGHISIENRTDCYGRRNSNVYKLNERS